MKRRFSSHTTLIELTLALFFLMLAMVTIIGLYTTAYGMSGEAQRITRAVQLAQDCTALIEGGEEPLEMLGENGFDVTSGNALLQLEQEKMSVHVTLEEEPSEWGILYRGTVSVSHEGTSILTRPVARYIIRK